MKRQAGTPGSGSGPYRAVLFDVGGTLLNIVRDPQIEALEAIAHLGKPPENYTAVIRQVYSEWRTSGGPPEVEDLPETWIAHHRRALSLLKFPGDIDAAAQTIENVFLSDCWEVYEETVDVLESLGGQGYTLGVISNWPSTLETTLQRAGLRHYFRIVVASGKVGYAKPHPRIFEIASEQLGVTPSEALYVGDSVEHDVAGAASAGMDVVLVARHERPESHQPRIRTLAGLHSLLKTR